MPVRSAGSGATNSKRFAGRGRNDLQSPRVQRLPLEDHGRVARVAAQLAARDPRPAAIEPIAQHRKADVGQVQTDLMRPSGLGQHLEGRKTVESLDHFVKRLRLAAVGTPATDRHLFAVRGMRSDRQVDQIAIAIGHPHHDRKILFLGRPLLELFGQPHVGGIGLGHHQHAAGVAIQPMHDARPRRAASRTQILEMKRQRTGQRPLPMPFGRMDHHARRLIDRRDFRILEQDVERDILGHGPDAWQIGEDHRDVLSHAEAMRCLWRGALRPSPPRR